MSGKHTIPTDGRKWANMDVSWESLTDEELRAEMESSENDANILALWDEEMYDFAGFED